MRWGGSCRGGLGHARVEWDGVSCRGKGGVGHLGVGWVMQG